MAIVKSVKVLFVILVVFAAIFLFCINISAFSTSSQLPLNKCDMLVYKEELVDQGLVYDFEVKHAPIKGNIKFYETYNKYIDTKVKVGKRITFHREKLSSKEEGLRYGFPLKVGMKWGEDPEYHRDNNMYCWYVEKIEDITVPAGTFKDCFKIVYYTCPDDTAEWYYPGIGIIKYEYHHHGTVTDEISELIKIVRK